MSSNMINSSTTSDFVPDPGDIVVVLMGMTGSGKSTFVTHFVDGRDDIVGHGLQGYTHAIEVYKFAYSDSVNVCLVDTPGFDDTNLSDGDVLRTVGAWLGKTYKENKLLNGIIYLHRITDPRMQGTARKNLFIFQKLCGKDALKNVTLVTTMWEDVKLEDGKRRERELIETPGFWGSMAAQHAHVDRHDNTQESAKRILERFFEREGIATSLQKELEKGKEVLDTEAGKELNIHWIKREETLNTEVQTTGKDLKEARETNNKEVVEELETRLKEAKAELKKLSEEREKLRVDLARLITMTRWVRGKTKIAGQGASKVLRERFTLKLSPVNEGSMESQSSQNRDTPIVQPASPDTSTFRPANRDTNNLHPADRDTNLLHPAAAAAMRRKSDASDLPYWSEGESDCTELVQH
ncbi:P-loop containing nucleoside triphosphate hydrolase protein [Pseudoneurospora amorphoporcata]|uniref:P-loop containing nucleoside triphosphate hydrolase protein n=1 Tax=Pseudoneurospora amorphoporcata TaxID=241081 RepID=A0AAN6NS48_9PEZI|nr:P-loop containing nucleoside triphosphate hydrolase protein [Pseudoneurospora amorphoporcata]